MTRKEALKWLKTFKGRYGVNELEDAVDTAIKALEQKPCEDAISREDALMCMTGEYLDDMQYNPEDIISKHIRRIKALPSVQPKKKTGHWIPVSEKLPEKNGWYQCTVIVNARPKTMELFYKNGRWLDNRRIDMFNAYDIYGYGCTKEKHKLSYQELISEFDWTENVIACMPLPEPYKAESEDKEWLGE